MAFLNLYQYDKSISVYASDFYSRLTMVKDFCLNQIVISPLITVTFIVFIAFLAYYLQNNWRKQIDKA